MRDSTSSDRGCAYLERVSAAERDQPIFHEHAARYEFASRFAAGKVVLDAASGTGYGSARLAGAARKVVGVDLAWDAVAASRAHGAAASHLQMNCTRLAFRAGVFDLVCAFEMIEHIADYRAVLRDFARVLKRDGRLIVSTPNRRPGDPVPPANPYHVQEFSAAEFRALLAEFFADVQLLGQRGSARVQEVRHGTRLKRWLRHLDPFEVRRLIPAGVYRGLHRAVGAPVAEDLSCADYVVAPGKVDDAEFVVAVCRSPR